MSCPYRPIPCWHDAGMTILTGKSARDGNIIKVVGASHEQHWKICIVGCNRCGQSVENYCNLNLSYYSILDDSSLIYVPSGTSVPPVILMTMRLGRSVWACDGCVCLSLWLGVCFGFLV